MDISRKDTEESDNIIVNHDFSSGMHSWGPNCCEAFLITDPSKFGSYVVVKNRKQTWHALEQVITSRVKPSCLYKVSATVAVSGSVEGLAEVKATLRLENPHKPTNFQSIAKTRVFKGKWVTLEGTFSLPSIPKRVVFFLEGPSPGIDLLIRSVSIQSISEPKLDSLTVKHAEKVPPSPPPSIENPAFGVNIVTNSQLSNYTTYGWFPFGNCKLSVMEGSPKFLPPLAIASLGPHQSLSGRYILVTNRTKTWMGPAQVITDKLKQFLTYQISVWVKVGAGINSPQTVNVVFGIDNEWVNGGQVEINDDKWHEIAGSFRIEKQPSKASVHIQGPSSGIDLMVAGLQIFPVNRRGRIEHLRRQCDKIRKREVTLKFSGIDSSKLSGAMVRVRQISNSFPVGTCIQKRNMDNEDFVDFFLRNFNWAVFGNELKWYWLEREGGKLDYKDADETLNLCTSNNIETRGHCIFWEVQETVQQWIQNLNPTDFKNAVQNRLTSLLNRYKGKFKHCDVNNEMLHGSFYQDKLGKDIRVNMFKTAHQLDSCATLFVNDYHIEDGCDSKSCPEKYIEQILDLQQKGTPVGGIGIQGHVESPVGQIVCAALDKLGILGLPIWFTELDVSSINEHVRAEDLEVMMWEAFGHPAVEGIMFKGRENSHLVNAEGDLNEAGKRFLAVKQDWLSHTDGHVDQNGAFKFRGYSGNYTVEVMSTTSSQKVLKSFVVEKEDSASVINLVLQGLFQE